MCFAVKNEHLAQVFNMYCTWIFYRQYINEKNYVPKIYYFEVQYHLQLIFKKIKIKWDNTN